MWIDSIVDFEAGRRLAAVKNISLAEDHMHDAVIVDPAGGTRPVMPASLIVEGMAQTAGILVGSTSRFEEKVILAKISRATLDADAFPGQTLRYEAELDRVDRVGAATRGTVARLDHARSAAGWEPIGRIDLLFSHLDRNISGVAFPEENFVFSDNFRLILRSAGLEELASGA